MTGCCRIKSENPSLSVLIKLGIIKERVNIYSQCLFGINSPFKEIRKIVGEMSVGEMSVGEMSAKK